MEINCHKKSNSKKNYISKSKSKPKSFSPIITDKELDIKTNTPNKNMKNIKKETTSHKMLFTNCLVFKDKPFKSSLSPPKSISKLTKINKFDNERLKQNEFFKYNYKITKGIFNNLILKPNHIIKLRSILNIYIDKLIFDTKKIAECKFRSTIYDLEKDDNNLNNYLESLLDSVLFLKNNEFDNQFKDHHTLILDKSKTVVRNETGFCYKSIVDPILKFLIQSRKDLIIQSLINENGEKEFIQRVKQNFQLELKNLNHDLYVGLKNLPESFLKKKQIKCDLEKSDKISVTSNLKNLSPRGLYITEKENGKLNYTNPTLDTRNTTISEPLTLNSITSTENIYFIFQIIFPVTVFLIIFLLIFRKYKNK